MKNWQLNGMTVPTNDSVTTTNVLERTCTLCKQTSNIYTKLVRHQSTHTNPSMKPARKRRPRGVKKYFDVLIVGENSTIEQKAKVKKLTSHDLNLFATTNLNLNEFYKLKDLMRINKTFVEHTYNNLTIIENMPGIVEATSSTIDVPMQSVIMPSISSVNDLPSVSHGYTSDNIASETVESDREYGDIMLNNNEMKYKSLNILEEFDPFQQIVPSSNAFQPELLEDETQEAIESMEGEDVKEDTKVKSEVQKVKSESLAKQEIVSRTLAAYIEMCSQANMLQKGLNALSAYKYRSLHSGTSLPIKDINVYNAALKSLASKGNFTKMQEVIRYAQSLQVALNVQSYVAIFECLGKCNIHNNHLKDIRIWAKEAKWNGFTFDKIMNEGIFHNDGRKYVLSAMQAYDKEYIPEYIPPNVQYDNSLLNELNNDEQLCHNGRNVEHATGIFTREKMEKMISKQMDIEKSGYVTVKNIENTSEPTQEILKYRQAFDDHIKMWEEIGLDAFNRNLVGLSATKLGNKLEPFMRSIPVKDFVSIMIDEAKVLAQGSETYSPTVGLLYRDLGNRVYARFKVLYKEKTEVLDKILQVHSKYCNDYVSCHSELDVLPTQFEMKNSRQIWQRFEYDERPTGSSLELDHQPWVPTVLQGVGKFLYNIIMRDFKIDANVMRGNKTKNHIAAFYTIFRHYGRIVKEEVKPHPILSKLYRASAQETLKFPAYQVPMTCPPIPWLSLNVGGYLVTPTEFVRLPHQAVTQKQRLQDSPIEQLYPSFDALNQLAAVPWKVNRRILECIIKVFNKGGSAKLNVPEHPATLAPPTPPSGELDKAQKFQVFRQKLQYRRKKSEMYSLWCDCLYRLSLANHYKEDIFWLPHNMDFRGRVYPVPPHLNHLGSDLARSILVFAEGRPLGPKGLDWLKLHMVNLTGLKKRDSIEDRLQFANEIMDKVFDSADHPLDGEMWWVSSDEPWQTLAVCMEIANAVRSPNPEKYISHFPVHQDGSCNGLQHYAALGRDSAGGYSVNLSPASKPQDVYSAVAALVEERRLKDVEAGNQIAKVLDGFVRRKVIKQTVMTTVYGVTRYGARLQIARQLKDIDEFPKEYVWSSSQYLTSKTFESLRSMFTSTREIQDWFTECARLISSVCGANVEWVTPLGLPIVQPYFRYKMTTSNGFYETFHMDKYSKPNVMKQKNAFPPNFIHSLDSSHMMLTSLHCERAGITFVSVHDCYWTHPSTVNIMNKICREQFVALHSEPILENLSIFLSEKYSYNTKDFNCDGSVGDAAKRKLNKVLRQLPRTGDFNIEEVLDSIYFFS
ncbi:hypothetical protein Trydic_g9443 [Trypoxylus dichotomus]